VSVVSLEIDDYPLATGAARIAVMGVCLEENGLRERPALSIHHSHPPVASLWFLWVKGGGVVPFPLFGIPACIQVAAPVLAFNTDLQADSPQLVGRF
jgi:hypothetical protein